MAYNKNNNRDRVVVYVNEDIRAHNIMVLDEERNNLGKFPRYKALQLAQEKGLDLVQVHYDPKEMISTAMITDYGKYMYKKQKDQKEKKRTQKVNQLKEIKISYAIGQNDLEMKAKKIRELLAGGHNVRISMRLRGRENIYAEKAAEKMMQFKETLSDVGKSQYDTPKRESSGYSIILFAK
ncbi:MAG: translation initiation factor IF-3 [candidate division SR1 bacterium]|nr:MAG: translation initiation factor IF-3 [candidate division SR1 bacterium]